MTSRGIRNRNPLNLRRTADKWQGLAEAQTDKDFFRFREPIWGIRAAAVTLITHHDRGDKTLRQHIVRWAPPIENDTGRYLANVAAWTGFAPDQALNLHFWEDLAPLIKAMIRQENGAQPYTDAQIDQGLALAGVLPTVKDLKKSRTIAASTAGVASTAGSGVLTAVQDQLGTLQGPMTMLSEYVSWAKYGLLAVALVSFGVVVYARWDDARKLAR